LIKIKVNDRVHEIDAEPDTPLLYVLTDDLQLKGPRFGCGLAQCGSCSVLLDGREIRSCVTPISEIKDGLVVTLDGLPQHYAKSKKLASAAELHPLQKALIDEQAPQCGYCYNGIIIKASELLSEKPNPSDEEIRAAMDGHLCRCGTYPRIMKAIRRAAEVVGFNVVLDCPFDRFTDDEASWGVVFSRLIPAEGQTVQSAS
jgi:aerobic-type carbon monoxide dehydrogenase small subunit (CoxS/CutS family)